MEKDEYCFPYEYGLPDEDGNNITTYTEVEIDRDVNEESQYFDENIDSYDLDPKRVVGVVGHDFDGIPVHGAQIERLGFEAS